MVKTSKVLKRKGKGFGQSKVKKIIETSLWNAEQIKNRNIQHFRNANKLDVRDKPFAALNALNRIFVHIDAAQLQPVCQRAL
ncbi:MAG: hypothetical protein K2K67_01015 [Treponemataceae bacterium]|nr:hypothetical protein [Treponemataceae bacterium]